MSQVEIIDNELKRAINEMLEYPKNYTGKLTKKDLSCLETLTIIDKNVESISGLEHAINLKSLNLSNNKIADISPLANLENLACLNLSHNYIIDIACISDIKELTYLNLSDNQIMDIDGIELLQKLIYLDVSDNQICSLKKLKDIKSLAKVNAVNQSIGIRKQTLMNNGDFTISINLLKDKNGKVPTIEHVSDSGLYNFHDNSVTWNNITNSKEYNFRFDTFDNFSGEIVVEIEVKKFATNE